MNHRQCHASQPPPNRAVTVADMAAFLGTPLIGPWKVRDMPLNDVVDDSRAVRVGDAYVAIPGQRWHGLDFQEQAASAGAIVAISDRPSAALPTLVVDDPRAAVGPLAAWFHRVPSRELRVFGITGTNGKTSTAHFIDAGLAATGETTALFSGVRIRGPAWDVIPARTTPEAATLQRALAHFHREGVTACAMEVSSHAVSQRRVDGTHFRVMAFTNLSHDHLDYHGTMEAYYATKAKMFAAERTEIAVINIEDPYGARLAADLNATTWTCSTTNPSADVYADGIICNVTGSRLTAHTPRGDVDLQLQLLGPHQVSNAVLALTSLVADGAEIEAAADGISSLTGVAGRCDLVHAGQDFIAIVDYMHNTAGQHALLPFMRSVATRQLILVIGATGGRDRSKRRPLGEVAASYADIVIVTDESPEDEDPAALRADVLAGARLVGNATVIEEPDRHRALELAVSCAGVGDVLVVAGRGSGTVQRIGPQVHHFSDHAHLHHIITASLGQ